VELKDRIWNLAAKKLAGEATESELKELSDLLKNNPETANVVARLEDWWLSSREAERNNSVMLFNRIREKINIDQQYAARFNGPVTDKYSQINVSMMRNYLKVAWRNLTKHKVYSGLNIGGLAIGIKRRRLENDLPFTGQSRYPPGYY
jgi:putative ABC transport system permease protein